VLSVEEPRTEGGEVAASDQKRQHEQVLRPFGALLSAQRTHLIGLASAIDRLAKGGAEVRAPATVARARALVAELRAVALELAVYGALGMETLTPPAEKGAL
jgi:hypothetical protein